MAPRCWISEIRLNCSKHPITDPIVTIATWASLIIYRSRKENIVSLNMRPVREEWGAPTSLFLDTDAVVDLLAKVSDSLGIAYGLNDTDEGTEVIIHEGGKFLDYVESKDFTAPTAYHVLKKDVNKQHLACLVQNLKSLVDNWRTFVHSGELRILVD
jgi:hypothetical protein